MSDGRSIGTTPRPPKYQINPAKVSQLRTICEVHRCLWRLIDTQIKPDNPELAQEARKLVEEAYDYAKRMSRRLRDYNKKAGHDFERDILDHDD